MASAFFVRYLFRLEKSAWSGTICFKSTDEFQSAESLPNAEGFENNVQGSIPSLKLVLHEGRFVDVISLSRPSLIENALLSQPGLKDRDLKKARKQAEHESLELAEVLLKQSNLSEIELAELLQNATEEALGSVFSQDELAFEFLPEGECSPEETEVGSGIKQYVQLPGFETILLNVAYRMNNWQLIEDALPSLKEVYYATPMTFSMFERENEDSGGLDTRGQIAILKQLDGQRDLREALLLAEVEPFSSLGTMQNMFTEGLIEAISPVQLFQLGCKYEREGNYEQARRRLERAEERDLDDFDIGYKLGEVYQQLGRDEEAIERFLAFAEKCVGQFRLEETIRACRKIIDIDPDNLPIYERYISLLSRYGKGDEALHEGLSLAKRFATGGEYSRAQATLEKIIELAGANEEILRFYIQLCEKSGHQEGAEQGRIQLGRLFYQRNEPEKALEMFQELFVTGRDSAEIRSCLAELHLSMGNSGKGIDHLQALAGFKGWNSRQASNEARDYFKKLLENGHQDSTILGWLIDDAKVRGDRSELSNFLQRHAQNLEQEGDWHGAQETIALLCQFHPKNKELLGRLAHAQEKLGHTQKAGISFEQLALLMVEAGEPASEIQLVLEKAIAANPLSTNARRLWKEHRGEECSEHLTSVELDTLLIEILQIGIPENFALPESEKTTALSSSLHYLAARSFLLRSNTEPAIQHCLKAAELAKNQRDYGLLAECVEILENESKDPDLIKEFKMQLEQAQPSAQSSPKPSVSKLVLPSAPSVAAATPGMDSIDEHPLGPSPIPAPKKALIGGSLAKLKALRTGDSPDNSSQTATNNAATGSPATDSPATDNATAPQLSDLAAALSAESADAPAAAASKTAAKPTDIQAKLAKLKNLQSPQSTPQEQNPVASSAPDMSELAEALNESPAPKVTQVKKMAGAAARLNALKNKGSSS